MNNSPTIATIGLVFMIILVAWQIVRDLTNNKSGDTKMKIPEKGFLSGYKTQGTAILGIVAVWAAYAFDAPVFGQEAVGLGETLAATVMGLLFIFQRAGTKKAEKAATVVVTNVIDSGPLGRIVPLILAGMLVLPAMGCAGQVARNEILAPALRLAADGVKEDVFRGVADAVSDGDIFPEQANDINVEAAGLWFAIAHEDREAIAERIPVWLMLRPYAERGVQDRVDDGEIGFGGAGSRLERIDLFGEALLKLTEGL